MKTNFTKKIVLAAAIAAIGMTGQASARMIQVSEAGGWLGSAISSPDYVVVGTEVSGQANGNATAPADTWTGVKWFDNDDPVDSGATLEFFSSEKDVADDGTVQTYLVSTLTQNNTVIQGRFPYTHVMGFSADFQISDADNGYADLFSTSPNGGLTHTETLNSAPCANPAPHNTVCDDIWGLELLDSPSGNFTIGNITYDYGFDFAFGPGVIFQGGLFYTREPGAASVDVLVNISARQPTIPEPTSIALLGAGLLGFGFTASRRRRKSA